MDKKLTGLIFIFFVAFFIFISIIVFRQPLTSLTRAREDQASATNSLIFAWPIVARANGTDGVTINVFVRNQDNKSISNKSVSVDSTLGTVKTVSNLSDSNGKTTFVLVSQTPGTAQLRATVDNATTLSKTLTIKFE